MPDTSLTLSDAQKHSISLFDKEITDLGVTPYKYLFGEFKLQCADIFESMINHPDDENMMHEDHHVYEFMCEMAGAKFDMDTEAVEALYHKHDMTDFEEDVFSYVEYYAQCVISDISEARDQNLREKYSSILTDLRAGDYNENAKALALHSLSYASNQPDMTNDCEASVQNLIDRVVKASGNKDFGIQYRSWLESIKP